MREFITALWVLTPLFHPSFDEYVASQKIKYSSPEEKERRREIYDRNLERIEQANEDEKNFGKNWALDILSQFNSDKMYEQAKHMIQFGVTAYTDWTVEEFIEKRIVPDKYMTLEDSGAGKSKRRGRMLPSVDAGPPDFDINALPKTVSWKGKHGLVVDDQKSCNSCYIFATLSLIVYEVKETFQAQIALSAQEIVDCLENSDGSDACNGGKPKNVFDYIINTGISLKSRYTEYSGKPRECKNAERLLLRISRSRNLSDNQSDLNLPPNGLKLSSQAEDQAPETFKEPVKTYGTEYYKTILQIPKLKDGDDDDTLVHSDSASNVPPPMAERKLFISGISMFNFGGQSTQSTAPDGPPEEVGNVLKETEEKLSAEKKAHLSAHTLGAKGVGTSEALSPFKQNNGDNKEAQTMVGDVTNVFQNTSPHNREIIVGNGTTTKNMRPNGVKSDIQNINTQASVLDLPQREKSGTVTSLARENNSEIPDINAEGVQIHVPQGTTTVAPKPNVQQTGANVAGIIPTNAGEAPAKGPQGATAAAPKPNAQQAGANVAGIIATNAGEAPAKGPQGATAAVQKPNPQQAGANVAGIIATNAGEAPAKGPQGATAAAPKPNAQQMGANGAGKVEPKAKADEKLVNGVSKANNQPPGNPQGNVPGIKEIGGNINLPPQGVIVPNPIPGNNAAAPLALQKPAVEAAKNTKEAIIPEKVAPHAKNTPPAAPLPTPQPKEKQAVAATPAAAVAPAVIPKAKDDKKAALMPTAILPAHMQPKPASNEADKALKNAALMPTAILPEHMQPKPAIAKGIEAEPAIKLPVQPEVLPNTPPPAAKPTARTKEGIESTKRFNILSKVNNLPNSVKHLLKALATSPVVVSHYIPVTDMQNYKQGVIACHLCTAGTPKRNHAALAVGYSIEEKYILFMNSWGAAWGEEGYYKIELDINALDTEGCCLVSGGGMNVMTKHLKFS